MRILIVDSPDELRTEAVIMLQDMGHSVVEADNGNQAVSVFQLAPPDLILIHAELPDMSSTAQQLRQMTGVHHWIPLFFYCDSVDETEIDRAIEAGADDLLIRPLDGNVLRFKFHTMARTGEMRLRIMEAGKNLQQSSEALASKSRELRQANEQLRRLATVDGLTGLSNRRVFDEALVREWSHGMRQGSELAIILCDVDRFKQYNDHYGHRAGDECLKAVGNALANNVRRATDYACRYGGEEFVLLMAMTPPDGALVVADKVLQSIRDMKIPHEASDVTDYVTMSMGVVSLVPSRDLSTDQFIDLADRALYEAKDSGRDKAIMAETDPPKVQAIGS